MRELWIGYMALREELISMTKTPGHCSICSAIPTSLPRSKPPVHALNHPRQLLRTSSCATLTTFLRGLDIHDTPTKPFPNSPKPLTRAPSQRISKQIVPLPTLLLRLPDSPDSSILRRAKGALHFVLLSGSYIKTPLVKTVLAQEMYGRQVQSRGAA